ncbi:MAG: hypothetical protein II131_01490, partial [Neisseriaceae bacterium]|nr:hypothetical protein [Neisseriaceae bacterium]
FRQPETFAKLASVADFFVMRCSKSRLTICYVFDFCATITLNSTHIYQFCKGFSLKEKKNLKTAV